MLSLLRGGEYGAKATQGVQSNCCAQNACGATGTKGRVVCSGLELSCLHNHPDNGQQDIPDECQQYCSIYVASETLISD